MKESALENKCRKYAVDRGCLFVKNQGTRGFPDRTIIGPNGITMYVEFKRPGGGVLSTLQEYYIYNLRQRSALVFVVDGFDQFKQLVEQYL